MTGPFIRDRKAFPSPRQLFRNQADLNIRPSAQGKGGFRFFACITLFLHDRAGRAGPDDLLKQFFVQAGRYRYDLGLSRLAQPEDRGRGLDTEEAPPALLLIYSHFYNRPGLFPF